MSNWKSKSDDSFKASNKLIIEALYNPSVHSSYYSCVQLVLHVLSAHYNHDDDYINDLNRNTEQSTHKYLHSKIYESLRQIDPDYAVDFNDDIGLLRDRRVSADYKSEIIEEEEAKELRQLAYTTNKMLVSSYRL